MRSLAISARGYIWRRVGGRYLPRIPRQDRMATAEEALCRVRKRRQQKLAGPRFASTAAASLGRPGVYCCCIDHQIQMQPLQGRCDSVTIIVAAAAEQPENGWPSASWLPGRQPSILL
jgi:hypothetical protein